MASVFYTDAPAGVNSCGYRNIIEPQTGEYVAALCARGYLEEAIATQRIQFQEGVERARAGVHVHSFEPSARQAGYRAELRAMRTERNRGVKNGRK